VWVNRIVPEYVDERTLGKRLLSTVLREPGAEMHLATRRSSSATGCRSSGVRAAPRSPLGVAGGRSVQTDRHSCGCVLVVDGGQGVGLGARRQLAVEVVAVVDGAPDVAGGQLRSSQPRPAWETLRPPKRRVCRP